MVLFSQCLSLVKKECIILMVYINEIIINLCIVIEIKLSIIQVPYFITCMASVLFFSKIAIALLYSL